MMPDLHGNFVDQVLRQMAESMGLTYEQLSDNYTAMESPEDRRLREVAARFYQQMEIECRYWDAIINAEIGRIVFSIWIAGPGIEHIVGYNPQRLLTYQPEKR